VFWGWEAMGRRGKERGEELVLVLTHCRGVVVAGFCPRRRRRRTASWRAPGTGAAGHHGDVRRGKRLF